MSSFSCMAILGECSLWCCPTVFLLERELFVKSLTPHRLNLYSNLYTHTFIPVTHCSQCNIFNCICDKRNWKSPFCFQTHWIHMSLKLMDFSTEWWQRPDDDAYITRENRIRMECVYSQRKEGASQSTRCLFYVQRLRGHLRALLKCGWPTLHTAPECSLCRQTDGGPKPTLSRC